MTQSAAGPLSDVVAAGACSVGSLFVHGAPATVLVLHAVFLWLAVITNLVPFLELDGYWVLADHLDRPQLHAESVAAARRMAASPVRGATRLGAYGMVSTLFGAGMLAVGLVAWWAVIGDVVVALAGGGAVGLLIAALLGASDGWGVAHPRDPTRGDGVVAAGSWTATSVCPAHPWRVGHTGRRVTGVGARPAAEGDAR